MSTGVPQRVLIVRLGAIGDVVNALVFATALKDASPATHVGWVVHPLAQPMVEGHPSVDRVHVWRRGGGLAELRRLIGELRLASYDLAVDLQRLAKSALVARLSGADRVLGYDRPRTKELSWLLTRERIAKGSPTSHMVDQYLEFARHLGLDAAPRHVLPVDESAEAWADALVHDLGGAPILVNLGATKPANRWEPARFGELASALHAELDAPVCFTGSEADRGAERAAVAASGRGPVSLVGQSDLRQLTALCRRARLFIGCDTGPMHIAVACGAPVVALFGPADPARTGPFGYAQDRHTVVRVPPPCSPCNRRTCNQPRHACMEDISVRMVVEAASRRLSTSPNPASSVGP